MKIIRPYKVFDTLLIFLFVLSGGGLLFVYFKKPLSAVICALSLFVCIFFGGKLKKHLFHSSVFTFIIFSAIIVLNFFIAHIENQEFIKYGFYLLNGLTVTLLYIHIFNNRGVDYFVKTLRVVLLILLFISLANFMFGVLVGYGTLKSLPWWKGEYHEVQHFSYLFFYDSEKHKYTIFGLDFVRNQGWFWEPGINQIYLNILLYLEFFVFKRRNRLIIILIVFSILTTFSTSGFIIMSILLVAMYINSIVRYIVKGNPIIIIGLSVSFLVPTYYIVQKVVIPNIINKTAGEKESSFQKRVFDLIQCPCIAADHPFTGVGLDKEAFHNFRSSYQMKNNCKSISNYLEDLTGLNFKTQSTDKGSSNSITGLMAKVGFPFSIILILFLFRQNLFNIRKRLFMSIVLISVFFEPVLLRPFFLILIISGMISFFNRFTK